LEVMEKYKTLQKYHMYFLISYFCAFWKKKTKKMCYMSTWPYYTHTISRTSANHYDDMAWYDIVLIRITNLQPQQEPHHVTWCFWFLRNVCHTCNWQNLTRRVFFE
jgi:hypothetical protein